MSAFFIGKELPITQPVRKIDPPDMNPAITESVFKEVEKLRFPPEFPIQTLLFRFGKKFLFLKQLKTTFFILGYFQKCQLKRKIIFHEIFFAPIL